jgi:O-antigen/teichoic acid export membrane protein
MSIEHSARPQISCERIHLSTFAPDSISREQIQEHERSRPEYFEVKALHDNLVDRSVRGGTVTIFGEATRFVLRLGSTAVLSRLLAPADFGLVAMVTTITGFVGILQGAGISMATVQQERINHAQVSTLFWVNVALAICLMLVTVALAPAIAWFYNDPRLTLITIALAATFLLSGLAIQHSALLRRQMQFGTIALVEVVALLASVLSGIMAAALGARHWSLVIMSLVASATGLILTWLFCSWRPASPQRGSGVRSMLIFGANLSIVDILSFVSRNADNLLVGAVWGAGPLGIYARAYQLLVLPLQQVTFPLGSVAIPALSRLHDDPKRYREYYYRFCEVMLAIGMPIAAFSIVAADAIVLTVLGPQWTACIGVYRAFGFAALFQVFSVALGSVFVSLGKSDKMLRAALCTTISYLIAFAIGVHWGPQGVAFSLTVVLGISTPAVALYAYYGSPLRICGLLASLWRPLISSMAAGYVTWCFFGLTSDGSYAAAFWLTLQAVTFAPIYLIVWMMLPGGRLFLRSIAVLTLSRLVCRQARPSNRAGGIARDLE